MRKPQSLKKTTIFFQIFCTFQNILASKQWSMFFLVDLLHSSGVIFKWNTLIGIQIDVSVNWSSKRDLEKEFRFRYTEPFCSPGQADSNNFRGDFRGFYRLNLEVFQFGSNLSTRRCTSVQKHFLRLSHLYLPPLNENWRRNLTVKFSLTINLTATYFHESTNNQRIHDYFF